MTPRQKLLHAPHLLRSYDEMMAARRAYDRTCAAIFLLITATLISCAALPWIAIYNGWLP